jgi:hypothetical protein
MSGNRSRFITVHQIGTVFDKASGMPLDVSIGFSYTNSSPSVYLLLPLRVESTMIHLLYSVERL